MQSTSQWVSEARLAGAYVQSGDWLAFRRRISFRRPLYISLFRILTVLSTIHGEQVVWLWTICATDLVDTLCDCTHLFNGQVNLMMPNSGLLLCVGIFFIDFSTITRRYGKSYTWGTSVVEYFILYETPKLPFASRFIFMIRRTKSTW